MSIPIFEVQFDKDGNQVIPTQEQDIIKALNAPGSAVTDVVLISHGWNNDMDEARSLYSNFFTSLEKVFPSAVGKTLAIGVLWPSKRFDDADLIPGGAASADNDPIADSVLLNRLEDLKGVFADPAADQTLEQAKALVNGLHSDTNKQNQFVTLLAALIDQHSDPAQRTPDEGTNTISDKAKASGGANLLRVFGQPIVPSLKVGAGGAAGMGGLGGNPTLRASTVGGAAGLGDMFSGVKAGALRLINFTTYNTMKDRAGKTGRDSVNPMLDRIQKATPQTLRFHLAGHSFGGRLVTATVDGQKPLRVQTLLLLQAAYSHNGLASNFLPGKNGFFHAVFDNQKVTGPIIITHSKNDRAVGLAYPLASRLNGDDAAGIGDASDRFGGMGANGAQHVSTAEIMLLPVGGGAYDFKTSGKRVFNVNGDAIITSHGDVGRPETAALLAAAMQL
jgi:hypothetical protein